MRRRNSGRAWPGAIAFLTLAGLALAALCGAIPAAQATPPTSAAAGPEAVETPSLGDGETLQIPFLARAWCPPEITITSMPAYGSSGYIQGTTQCAAPASYRIAVYIYTTSWWAKPYAASPLTAIQSDGSWSCNVTTGAGDTEATRFAAFLVPTSYTPPLLLGASTLPDELYTRSVDYQIANRTAVYRQITFAGRTWNVKRSDGTVGPGPNYFSDSTDDIWVDGNGYLHLKIVQRSGRWYCTEVFSEDALGYGTYTFQTTCRADQLDPNVVLGLFTWDNDAPAYHYREIDVELGRWGATNNDNAQFVVQPWQTASNMHRFDIPASGSAFTHGFVWRASSVYFQSLNGTHSIPGATADQIATWTYTGSDLPPAGQGNARINLWLLDGDAPTDGQSVEVVVTNFSYTP